MLKLKWLGTAGFHITYKDVEILLDPFISRPEGANPFFSYTIYDFERVKAILISHGHFDHVMDVPRLAKISEAKIIAPLICCKNLKKIGINPDRLYANEKTKIYELNHNISIEIIPSRHILFDSEMVLKTLLKIFKGGIFFKLLPLVLNYPMGSNSEFLLNFDGYKVLFSGSGGGDFHKLADFNPDCFLLPFAGRTDVIAHYMNAIKILSPKTVILHHFDNFYPNFSVKYPVYEFHEAVVKNFPNIKIIIPEANEVYYVP
ncbi:MAG: MBL fold metallo-hydrolase [Desulfobacterales bacterium]|nr:MBL fold metallo-hydrolase [Desulfobacterales bacterium]